LLTSLKGYDWWHYSEVKKWISNMTEMVWFYVISSVVFLNFYSPLVCVHNQVW
jgi:hypothetical protein